jgi:1-acyl-sn-glycerol-3-phosphate acyltransferase
VASPLRALLARADTRRALSVPTVAVGSALLTGTAPFWAPAAVVVDLVRSGPRLPLSRGLGFAWAWTSLETVGVAAATGLALAGRGDDVDAHYALQRWWTNRLVDSLGLFADLRIEVDGAEHLGAGPLVLLGQHVSIVDSLLPAWLLANAGMRPRFVLKDDLLIDPCLDIVGNRVPNYFLDRMPDDVGTEIDAIEALARGMGPADGAVIFPESMVVTPERRARAIARLEERDPERAKRLAGLRTLAPVRPAGTRALLRGAPAADVVIVTHTGLEALRRVADAPASVPLRDPVRATITRYARSDVPAEPDAFDDWLDARWLEADAALD